MYWITFSGLKLVFILHSCRIFFAFVKRWALRVSPKPNNVGMCALHRNVSCNKNKCLMLNIEKKKKLFWCHCCSETISRFPAFLFGAKSRLLFPPPRQCASACVCVAAGLCSIIGLASRLMHWLCWFLWCSGWMKWCLCLPGVILTAFAVFAPIKRGGMKRRAAVWSAGEMIEVFYHISLHFNIVDVLFLALVLLQRLLVEVSDENKPPQLLHTWILAKNGRNCEVANC